MSYIEIKNAVIKSTFLGKEDHGIPTCYLTLDYGASIQGFGGYDLRYEKYQIDFLMEVLRVLEVRQWEDLPGKVCRVKADRGKVYAIGHFIKDQWFEPEASE